VRVNLIVLAGAGLGLVCMVLPWAVGSIHLVANGQDWVIKIMTIRPSPFFSIPSGHSACHDEHILPLHIAAALFAGGSLVAILTPLGGFGQLAGILIFAWKLESALTFMLAPPPLLPGTPGVLSWGYEFSAGYYLTILATMLTLLSLLISVSIDSATGFKPRASIRPPTKETLLTFGRSPKRDKMNTEDGDGELAH